MQLDIFNLTNDTKKRLRDKSMDFQRKRLLLHSIIDVYVADFMNSKCSLTQNYETLRQEFSPKISTLNHLICNSNGSVLWTVPDIAILLGKQRTSITRTLKHYKPRSRGFAVYTSMVFHFSGIQRLSEFN